jgi:hypothetical protein
VNRRAGERQPFIGQTQGWRKADILSAHAAPLLYDLARRGMTIRRLRWTMKLRLSRLTHPIMPCTTTQS